MLNFDTSRICCKIIKAEKNQSDLREPNPPDTNAQNGENLIDFSIKTLN